jgi:predicted AAA+ superfamily ATPase
MEQISFERDELKDLEHWLYSSIRQPLIMRGARQVGKSTLVRMLAQKSGYTLVEWILKKILSLLIFFNPKILFTL